MPSIHNLQNNCRLQITTNSNRTDGVRAVEQNRFLGTFRVRHATLRDAARLNKFYEHNQHENNAARQDEVLLKQVRERNIFIVTGEDGQILAVAGLFEHLDGDFREFGATRVLGTLGGFGFQELLIAVRHVHAQVLELQPPCIFFATVRPGAVRSRRNLERLGFVQWDNPDKRLIREKEKLAVEENKLLPKLTFLKIPKDTVFQNARLVLGWQANPERERINREDQARERIRVELLIESLLYYRPVVEDLASGKTPQK